MIINPYSFGSGGTGCGDADGSAFITAAGITDPTQRTAVCQLVTDLKAASIWSKMVAIYPFVGGSASSHKYNLKDPQDTDGAFRITISGTVTHDANGWTGNGTDGIGNTHLIPFTHLTQFDTHMAIYSRTSSSSNIFEMAAFEGSGARMYVAPRHGGNMISAQYSDSAFTGPGTIGFANSDARGFYVGVRRANNSHELYQNGISQGEVTGTETVALPNSFIPIGGQSSDNVAVDFSPMNIAFTSVGAALSDSEVSDYYSAVQDFQTALSRNV